MSVPRAFSFELGPCADPQCKALHITSFDEEGHPVMNTALSPEAMKAMVEILRDHLYAVAAQEE